MLALKKESFDYAPYYCEENIWRLALRPELSLFSLWAVFASNPARDMVMTRQRAGRPVDGMLHWDYHVFALIEDRSEGLCVMDFDSELPFPCEAIAYIASSFPADVQRENRPLFRLACGKDFARDFASDRSHMRKADGGWMSPPPPWPAPLAADRDGAVGLARWTCMNRSAPGIVLDRGGLESFIRRAGRGALRPRRRP